jgi:uncharacterized membrane protein YphA (DoxX/SURF4 family)
MIGIVGWILRVGLGGLFVYAGIMKLGDPTQFAIEITNYRMAPGLAPWAAIILPYVEIACGVGAIVLTQRWRRAAALAITGMLVLFTVAVVAALARGINIDCGCFGGGASPVDSFTVARDVALFGASLALVVIDRERVSV